MRLKNGNLNTRSYHKERDELRCLFDETLQIVLLQAHLRRSRGRTARRRRRDILATCAVGLGMILVQ